MSRPTYFEPSRQLLEAASWRVVAELIRRHPRLLAVIETHQGGGQADCLTLLRPGRPMSDGSISLNRPGSAHFHTFDDSPDPGSWGEFWQAFVCASDPRDVLLELERRAGITAPAALPSSTATVVAYRVIAAIIATAAFGRTTIECRNGVLDSSGVGGSGRREELFAAFPEVRSRAQHTSQGDWFDESGYRFWFIQREGEPVVALDPGAGKAWSRTGLEFDLARLWRASGRRVGLVASWVGADLLV